MGGTRKARVPMSEQIRLINECRQSGMTDADWCRENDIAVSTFYNWVSRCRKAAANQIPAANYGHLEVPRPKQDVVPIDIVPDHIPEQHTASRMLNSHLDNCSAHQNISSASGALMLGDISGLEKIYIVCGYTDMRKSIDGLCAIIEDQLKMDPSSSALFLFCGRRRDRIKALFREPDGFVLIYKRLSVRGGYQWPRKQSEVRNLSWREFDWLMSGIDIDQPKALKAE